MSWVRLAVWSLVAALVAYGLFERTMEYQTTGMLYLANTDGKIHLSGTAAKATLGGIFIVLVVLLINLIAQFRKKLNGK